MRRGEVKSRNSGALGASYANLRSAWQCARPTCWRPAGHCLRPAAAHLRDFILGVLEVNGCGVDRPDFLGALTARRHAVEKGVVHRRADGKALARSEAKELTEQCDGRGWLARAGWRERDGESGMARAGVSGMMWVG